MKAEVKFCSTKNGHKAFVSTYNDNWEPSNEPLLAYRKDMRSIRSASPYEEGKDYRVVMSPWVLDDFFQANKIDSVQLVSGANLASPPVGNVRYANEDQLVWYEFSTATTTRRCSDITHAKAFIQEWVNYDCPDLYRYTTNQKDLLVSVWGFALPIFNCALIENRDCELFVDSDITVEEINGILKYVSPDGAIAEKMRLAREARALGEEGLKNLQAEIKKVCDDINALLQKPEHHEAILAEQNTHVNEAQMFDCGWLNWIPTPGTELARKFDLLRSSGKGTYHLEILMPIAEQSVNVQSYGANLMRKLVKENLGYDISYIRHLD